MPTRRNPYPALLVAAMIPALVLGGVWKLAESRQPPAVDVSQDLYVSGTLKSARVMVKDEDVCLHCGLCAERCPTGAWDMQKFLLLTAKAGGAGSYGIHSAERTAT